MGYFSILEGLEIKDWQNVECLSMWTQIHMESTLYCIHALLQPPCRRPLGSLRLPCISSAVGEKWMCDEWTPKDVCGEASTLPHSLQNLTHSSDTPATCVHILYTHTFHEVFYILTSSSITITFKNGMHLRKLSSAQMPAKTQIIRLCHVKGSSRLDGPARNFHLFMLVFNALYL